MPHRADPADRPASRATAADKPRWARRKEARHGELVAAALELFVERGFAATRIDDVAARAGVSKGTMYLYFANKEELFRAVIREAVVPMIAVGKDLVRNFEGPSAALLGELMHGWWDMVGQNRAAGIMKLVMAEASNFPEVARFYYDEVVRPGRQLFQDVLERGMARGEFRRLDATTTAQVLMAPIVMLIMWTHSIGPCVPQPLPEPGQYIDHALDLALGGLVAAAPARR